MVFTKKNLSTKVQIFSMVALSLSIEDTFSEICVNNVPTARSLFGVGKQPNLHMHSQNAIFSLRGGQDGKEDEDSSRKHDLSSVDCNGGNATLSKGSDEKSDLQQNIPETGGLEEEFNQDEDIDESFETESTSKTNITNSNETVANKNDLDYNSTDFIETQTLFPKQFYTTIFNHRNTIYGKGKFYTKRERIENLLRKWENDDMRQIQEICDKREDDDDNDDSTLKEMKELKSLKSLIYERAWKYIDEVRQSEHKALEKGKMGTIIHPKKVLHYLTPKIPAIKQSPEIMLRIQSARTAVDVSAAVSAIAAMAAITEYYSCVIIELQTKFHEKKRKQGDVDFLKAADELYVYKDIILDRRFEQLVECIQCAFDVEYFVEKTSLSHDVVGVLGKNDSEIPKYTEGISPIDVGRTVWAMMIFLSNQDVDEIGGIKCPTFIQALQNYSIIILINRLGDILHENNNQSMTPTERCNAFIDEIKHLLKEVVISLWSSRRTKKYKKYYNKNLVQTCCFILLQDVKEAWLSTQMKERKESNIDKIVERLAEAEERNTDKSLNDNQSDDDSTIVSKIITSLHANDKSFLHFLSLRDLMVTLNALINLEDDDIIINNLTKAISTWIENDIKTFHQNNTEALPFELVDAESILVSNTEYIGEGNNIIHDNDDQRFDLSKLSFSLNDLSIFVWCLGNINDEFAPQYLKQCIQLSSLWFRSENIHNLDNENALKLLEGSVNHAKNLFQMESSEDFALKYYTNITDLVLDRFTEQIDDRQDITTITPSELISMVSSFHTIIEINSMRDNHLNKTFDFLLNHTMKQVSEDTGLFSLKEMCKISWIYIQSHTDEKLPLIFSKTFGIIAAKIFVELNRWKESCISDSLSYDGEFSSSTTFGYLCDFLVGLIGINLPPMQWFPSLSIIFQNTNPDISRNHLVRLLHATAELKIKSDDNVTLNSLHLNSVVQSLLKKNHHVLYDSSWDTSMDLFVMFVWSMTIHGVKDLGRRIEVPDGLIDALNSLSPQMKVKLVVALTFSFKRKFETILLSSIVLKKLESEIELLNSSQICDLASSCYYLKYLVQKSFKSKEVKSDGTEENEREKIVQSIEKMSSIISNQIMSRGKDFSMEQVKNLLSFKHQSISSEISECAIEYLRAKNKLKDTSLGAQKRFFGAINPINLESSEHEKDSIISTYEKQLAFDNGWLLELLGSFL